MSYIKEFVDEDKMDEIEWDAMEDKICEHILCTACGNSPEVWPIFVKDNWYAGECDTCNKYSEFYFNPEEVDND